MMMMMRKRRKTSLQEKGSQERDVGRGGVGDVKTRRQVEVNQQEGKEKMRRERERKRKMNGNVNDVFLEEGFGVGNVKRDERGMREGQTNPSEGDHPSCDLLLLSSHPLNKHQTSIHPILKERRRDDPSFLLFGSSHLMTPLRERGIRGRRSSGMKERMKCLQDERELRSNHHSFARSNSRETRRQQHKPTRDGETTQHNTTQHNTTQEDNKNNRRRCVEPQTSFSDAG